VLFLIIIAVHDFQSLLSSDDKTNASDEDAEDEDDTILSSTAIHTQLIPNIKSVAENAFKKASCRAVHFSNNKGQHVYTGGSAGDLVCIDATRVCTFSANSDAGSTIVWRVQAASVGTSHQNPMHVLHQLPDTCSKGSLIVSGDDHGGVRLWDGRLCDTACQHHQQIDLVRCKYHKDVCFLGRNIKTTFLH
jgi:hypothetical protein